MKKIFGKMNRVDKIMIFVIMGLIIALIVFTTLIINNKSRLDKRNRFVDAYATVVNDYNVENLLTSPETIYEYLERKGMDKSVFIPMQSYYSIQKVTPISGFILIWDNSQIVFYLSEAEIIYLNIKTGFKYFQIDVSSTPLFIVNSEVIFKELSENIESLMNDYELVFDVSEIQIDQTVKVTYR